MQNTETILIALVVAIGVLVLVQVVVMFAMFLAVRKGMQAASEHADEMKAKVNPVLDQSKELLETARRLITRIEPKLETAASDLADITRTVSDEAKKMQASADEITERVRRQAARMDGMTTNALDNVDRAGRLLSTAVTTPLRQVSGVMAAAKAILDVLRTPTAPRRHAARETQARQDEGQFI